MSVWLKTSLVTMAICAIGLGIWIVSVPRDRIETATTGPSVTAAAPSKPDVARATARKPKRTPGAADTTPPWPDPSTVIVASYLVTQPKLVDRIKPLLQRGTDIELAAQGFRTAEQFAAVAHGGGAVAVERAEVARSIDQRISQRERLRHPHERLVEGRVAMRMVIAHHVPHDLRALPVLGISREALLPHRVEDPPLYRLQPVADVRQRARGDDRQRVIEVAGLGGFVESDSLRVGGTVRGTSVHRCAAVVIEQRWVFLTALGHGD